MPGRNGMGPDSMGPGTGRGMGYCNGFVRPDGYGRGHRGSGRSFRRPETGYYNLPRRLSEEEYKIVLRDEIDYLEKRLTALKEELDPADHDSE